MSKVDRDFAHILPEPYQTKFCAIASRRSLNLTIALSVVAPIVFFAGVYIGTII